MIMSAWPRFFLLTVAFFLPIVCHSQEAHKELKLSASRAEANLIHKVEPSYPQIAKIAHIQGDVVLRVRIGKNGELNEIKLLSGHPLLVQSAFDAVKQWRYRPYLLNGDPVEVETTITIKYHL